MFIKLRQGHKKFLITILILLTFNIMIFREIFVPKTCYAARFNSENDTVNYGKTFYENGLITRKTARNEEDLEKSIKKFKKAIDDLKEDDPLRKEIYFQLGYSYYLLGNYREAKEYFDKDIPYKRSELEKRGIAPKIISFALAPRTTELDREKKKDKDEKPWFEKWYWWTLILALVGGGTAAAVSSGGGGNGGSSNDTPDAGSDSVPIRW